MHRTKLAAAGLALTMSLTTAAVTTVATTVAAASPISCPDNNWRTADGRTVTGITGTIRTGPSTACPASGITGPGQRLRLDCAKTTATGVWSHVSDLDTGLRGWLAGDYANAPCESTE